MFELYEIYLAGFVPPCVYICIFYLFSLSLLIILSVCVSAFSFYFVCFLFGYSLTELLINVLLLLVPIM